METPRSRARSLPLWFRSGRSGERSSRPGRRFVAVLVASAVLLGSASAGGSSSSTISRSVLVGAVPGTSVQPSAGAARRVQAAAEVGGATIGVAASGKHPKAKSGTTANPALARVNGARSGLGWASGVYVPGSSPAKVAAFGVWRRAAVDVAVDWPARSSWSDVIDPQWLYDAWHGTPYTKVFGVAMLPENDPTATMARCAAGAYDARWLQFGRTIAASGLSGQTVIRLGWEFNGNWYKWQASNPVQYVRCWQQIVGTVRTVAPALLWDWSVNRGVGQALPDARKAYPGDGYVDIVGVDSYDMYPAASTTAGWQQQYAGAYGLKFWSDFAARHGKKLSVPEWGVYPGSAHAGHNGGDDPLYIGHMQAFFAAEGSRLAYEAYFNESAAYYAGSLYSPAQNPRAAARYRTLFGH